MSIKLYNCDCLYEETENKANTEVKGYILVSECDVCKAKREEEALISEQKRQDAEAKRLARESFKSKLEALGTFTKEEIDSIL